MQELVQRQRSDRCSSASRPMAQAKRKARDQSVPNEEKQAHSGDVAAGEQPDEGTDPQTHAKPRGIRLAAKRP